MEITIEDYLKDEDRKRIVHKLDSHINFLKEIEKYCQENKYTDELNYAISKVQELRYLIRYVKR